MGEPTMVERVARAMYAINRSRPIMAKEWWTWEELPQDNRDELLQLARAAIAAMREPTEAMVDAGWRQYAAASKTGVAMTWRRLIDTALADARAGGEA